MIEIEARRYTTEQVERWRPGPKGARYLDHNTIGEPPNAVHRSTLEGDRWLPDGLPEGAAIVVVECGPKRQAAWVPLTDGQAVFGTGFATFRWTGIGVGDGNGRRLWAADLDLGSKRPDDVWIVTVKPDR